MPAPVESYVESAPIPELRGVVRTVWIQRTGAADHVHRHLPSGGVELHFPIGRRPHLLGPLTGAVVEIIPPGTTIVGVRFHPGTAPPLPTTLDDLVDQRIDLGELWTHTADRLLEALAQAPTPELALASLQARLLHDFRTANRVDRLVAEAARALMPWQPVSVEGLAGDLGLSSSQLRRRFLHTVGTTPKVLQRTLRFQGFLALAQAGRSTTTAELATAAGYADQPHLNRECLRLTGQTPTEFLRTNITRCTCDHDHAGSYQPFLARR